MDIGTSMPLTTVTGASFQQRTKIFLVSKEEAMLDNIKGEKIHSSNKKSIQLLLSLLQGPETWSPEGLNPAAVKCVDIYDHHWHEGLKISCQNSLESQRATHLSQKTTLTTSELTAQAGLIYAFLDRKASVQDMQAIRNKDLLVPLFTEHYFPLLWVTPFSKWREDGAKEHSCLLRHPSSSCGKEKEGQVATLAKVFVKYSEIAELLCSCPNLVRKWRFSIV